MVVKILKYLLLLFSGTMLHYMLLV